MTQLLAVGVICWLAGLAMGQVLGAWAFVALVKRAAVATEQQELTAKLADREVPR